MLIDERVVRKHFQGVVIIEYNDESSGLVCLNVFDQELAVFALKKLCNAFVSAVRALYVPDKVFLRTVDLQSRIIKIATAHDNMITMRDTPRALNVECVFSDLLFAAANCLYLPSFSKLKPLQVSGTARSPQ